MERAAAEQAMAWTRVSRALQLVELGEQKAGMGDCVDADIVATSVRRPASQRDIEPGESAMSRTDRKSRWLGDDCCIGADPRPEQTAQAEALVFLVHDRGDENLDR